MGALNKTALAVSWCDTHRKLCYTDRKRARTAARRHPEHKNSYRCTDNLALWHIGTLPDEVKHGHMTKDEYYGHWDEAL